MYQNEIMHCFFNLFFPHVHFSFHRCLFHRARNACFMRRESHQGLILRNDKIMSSECTILWFIAATVAAVTKVSRDAWFPRHRFRLTWMTSHGDRRSWSTDTTAITTRTRTFASYASSTLTFRWDYISFILLNVLLNKLLNIYIFPSQV